MKTLKVTAEVEILRTATRVFITDLGGSIGYSWDMEQCGSNVWWTSHGYVNGECVKMRYYQGADHIEINNQLVGIIVD